MVKLKKVFWISLIAFIFCYPGFSKDLAVNSAWTTVTLNIDGNIEEWAGDVMNSEEKLSIDLAFRNDSDYLYIFFKFKDPQFMSSIGETGMTLYFSTEGKRKKDYGLKFVREEVPAEAFIKILEGQRGPLTEEQKKEVMTRKTYSIRLYKILEKGKELEVPSDVEQTERAVFRTELSRETKTAVYEIAIPLEKAADKATGIGTQAGQDIKVGFEWGGLTPERRAQLMKTVGDRSAQADAGAATGNVTSERGVSDGGTTISSIARMAPKKYIFWVDLKLAKQ